MDEVSLDRVPVKRVNKRKLKMPEILLSATSSDARTVLSQCGLTEGLLFGRNCEPTDNVQAYNPYLLGRKPSLSDHTIVGELVAGNASRKLTELSQCFGADQIHDLAEFREYIASMGVGSIGTTASVYTDRTNGFVKALEKYQKALLAFRDSIKSGSQLAGAKRAEAQRAFNHLQTHFQSEMKIITSRSRSRRGTPLTHSERALNIATSSRKADKLYVANQAQAHNLVRFTRHAKVLGNGLAVIDFGTRIGRVHTSYLAGDNWNREMFTQSLSFATSAAASIGAIKGGLVLLAVFTPAGLVGLVVAGAAVALGAAGTAVATNYVVEKNSGSWYDDIMHWLAN